MDWTSIIVSSAFATIISGGFTYFFKSIDYKYDYKKYILKKRQEAYSEIEGLLKTFNKVILSDKGNKKIHVFFNEGVYWGMRGDLIEYDPVQDYLNHILTIRGNQTFWLSSKLYNDLTILLNILAEVQENRTNKSIDLEEIGVNFFDKIEKLRICICKQFFDDIKKLKNIEVFIKEKSFTSFEKN